MYEHIKWKTKPVEVTKSEVSFESINCQFFLNKWSKIFSGEFMQSQLQTKKKQYVQNHFPS